MKLPIRTWTEWLANVVVGGIVYALISSGFGVIATALTSLVTPMREPQYYFFLAGVFMVATGLGMALLRVAVAQVPPSLYTKPPDPAELAELEASKESRRELRGTIQSVLDELDEKGRLLGRSLEEGRFLWDLKARLWTSAWTQAQDRLRRADGFAPTYEVTRTAYSAIEEIEQWRGDAAWRDDEWTIMESDLDIFGRVLNEISAAERELRDFRDGLQ